MSRIERRASYGAIGAGVMTLIACLSIGAAANAQQVFTAAVGVGTVPAGEYAGQTIRAVIIGSYSGVGLTTLTDGRAVVWIGARRFDSVVSSSIPSFCCGEGHVGTDFFSMTGWVRENAPGGQHNHLFGASATTDGTMCINIADQTNSVVPPAVPVHDPGVGLICGIRALVVIIPVGAPLIALNHGPVADGTDPTADSMAGWLVPTFVSPAWKARAFLQARPA